MSLDQMRRELKLKYLEGVNEGSKEIVPWPEMVTHGTDILSGRKILSEGMIKATIPELEPIPRVCLSMDTTIWAPRGTVFVFDVEPLRKGELKPVFYLFSTWAQGWYFESGLPYGIMQWIMFPWTEAYSERDVLVSPLAYVVTPDDETKQKCEELGFEVRSRVEVTKFSRSIYEKRNYMMEAPADLIPTEPIREFLHNYNTTMSNFYNVDYPQVLELAEKVARQNPERYGPVWW